MSRTTYADMSIDCRACFDRPHGEWMPANKATRTYRGSIWIGTTEVLRGTVEQPLWVCQTCYLRLNKRARRDAQRLAAAA